MIDCSILYPSIEITMRIPMENKTNYKHHKNRLSNGPSAILRPLYNSNLAKVSVVK